VLRVARDVIKRSDIREIATDYDPDDLHIGIFGSHSALPIGYAAHRAGLPSILYAKEGRERTYAEYNLDLFDEIVLLDDWKELLGRQDEMRARNVVFIPNRSFVVYVGLDEIETEFEVPIYGSRELLRAEERTSPPPRNQYYLMEKAGVRKPRLFDDPEDIDRLCVVKVQQRDNPLERAYFYPSDPGEYREMAEARVESGQISEEGLEKAAIEEFVVGPMLNANFHSYGLNMEPPKAFPTDIDLLGFSDREQTNETGFRGLPARLQLELEESGFRRTNEEICHRGKTLRESKLETIYDYAERIMDTLKEEVPPGMIGPIGIQGAVTTDENGRPEFVVFDLSFRVPGDPAMGPTSPYLRYLDVKHLPIYREFMEPNWRVESPLDVSMMEIAKAVHDDRLGDTVT